GCRRSSGREPRGDRQRIPADRRAAVPPPDAPSRPPRRPATWAGTLMPTITAPTRGHRMRPSLQILDDELIDRIVDEAMRVLAEVGMEIRGKGMRQRLIDHGLP